MLQLIRSLEKAYVISVNSVEDIKNLYRSLGLVRSLLMVQVCPDEEELLKQSIWYLPTVLTRQFCRIAQHLLSVVVFLGCVLVPICWIMCSLFAEGCYAAGNLPGSESASCRPLTNHTCLYSPA